MSRTEGTRRQRYTLTITFAIVAFLLIAVILFARVFTDYLWFSQLNYATVFTTQLAAEAGLFVVFGSLLAFALYVAMSIAYRLRPKTRRANLDSELLIQFRDMLDAKSRTLMVFPSGVLGVLGGATASAMAPTFLAWTRATQFGVSDAYFGMDASFYVFELPWWRFVLGYVIFVAIASTIASVIVHFLTGSLTIMAVRNSGNDRTASKAGQRQVSILMGVVVVLVGVGQFLDRYSYLTTQNSLFTGMSFTDHNARVNAHLIIAVACVIVAVMFFINAWKLRWSVPLVSVAMLVLTSMLVAIGYPLFMQQFEVRPNEQDVERPYLAANIEATREAFDIDHVEIEDYEPTVEVSAGQLREDTAAVPAIRLMDPAVVGQTFEQLQQVRGYYTFPSTLKVDRYDIDGRETDAVVAARELDLTTVEAGDTWNNKRTVYTHGYGLVAAFGNQRQSNGEPVFFAEGIPTVGKLPEHQPRIYYGEKANQWVVAGAPEGSTPVEFDTPGGAEGGGEALSTYEGSGGVPIGNWFTRALFAVRLGDINLMLSERVNQDSRLLMNRVPLDRVKAAAPWLTVDSEAYPSVVDGKIVWIVDGYTTTAEYPNSTRLDWSSAISDTRTQSDHLVSGSQVNYVRNSVKATVDAYDGTVTLYEWDENDPVLKTWSKVYPGTVTPKEEISPELLAHLRYPQDLFKVQRAALGRYHTTNPNTLYQESDIWEVPNDPVNGGDSKLKEPPYFLTVRWPGDSEPVYSNTTVFVPRGRENLSVYLAVNADARSENYGQMRVLKLSDEQQIAGPGQTFNAIQTDEEVAQTLLPFNRQGSATAIFGNLLTLPVGGGLLYVQPIYTQNSATSGAYPALRFVVVRFGEHVGIGQTLQEALDEVFAGDAGARTDEDVEPTTTSPSPDPTDPAPGGGDSSAKELLEEAVALSDQADAALRSGDLAEYQRLTEQSRSKVTAALELIDDQ